MSYGGGGNSSIPKGRKMTPKGQMSSSGSGPAIMMMPNHIRSTFMPDPPLDVLPPPRRRRPKYYGDKDLDSGGSSSNAVIVGGDKNGKDDNTENDNNSNSNSKNNMNHKLVKLEMGDPSIVTNTAKNLSAGTIGSSTSGGGGKKIQTLTGVATYMSQFERTPAPERKIQPTPKSISVQRAKRRAHKTKEAMAPLVEEYRSHQNECAGEYDGMNCYNTLFVGRLAYEVTERKLLRELENFGPVKDVKLILQREEEEKEEKKKEKQQREESSMNENRKKHSAPGTTTTSGSGSKSKNISKSRGYAFVEYEHEEDMKKAYRAADGMKIEGRAIVCDVERGHTVPNWLPRRLGGGLGGTRIGGKEENVITPGRFDPSKPPLMPPHGMMGMGGPPPPMGNDAGYAMGPGERERGRGGGGNYNMPPHSGPNGGGYGMGGGGGPPRGPPPQGYGHYGSGSGGGSTGGGNSGSYGHGGGRDSRYDRGPPPPGYGMDRGRSGGGGDRGGGHYGGGHGNGGPPPGYYGGGGGRAGPPAGRYDGSSHRGGERDRDRDRDRGGRDRDYRGMKRGRSRSRSPEWNKSRRGRY
mmetsp:Transcript_20363/g.28635  ORF Transcript_20363/g.28635 Transcript_20363/m.28635 type:complete len:579 (-) Transcript_20363:836-2572(-)